jgi:hypothetical protein
LSPQGDVYSTFVASELGDENQRRENINTQAGRVIAGSGALFAVATALVVFVRGKNYQPDPHWSWLFGVALVSYLLSVGTGLVASATHKTPAASPGTLRTMIGEHWTDNEISAKNYVAYAKINQIEGLREGNNTKTKWLKRSLVLQVLAVAALGFAVVLSLR